MVFAETIRNQMVPPCMERRGEMDNRANILFGYCANTAFLSVWLLCANASGNRCQEDLNSFPYGELEETTRTLLYYVDEEYLARPEIQQSLPE